MRTRYQQTRSGPVASYQCLEASVRRAAKACQSVQGRTLDAAISNLLLDKVAPTALELAVKVQDEIAGRIEQADALRGKQLERARYEADLARRRYLKVDPDNRLVADALEADWNDRLRQIGALQQSHDAQRQAHSVTLDAQARERITALARDFPRVWNDPRTAAVERKRMLALLIEDVTITAGPAHITAGIRWRGGQVETIEVDRTKTIAAVRKTTREVIAEIDRLLESCNDAQAARRLNEMGYGNWRQEPFTYQKVCRLRRRYHLSSRIERLRAQGYLAAKVLAKQLGVCIATVHDWGGKGLLQRENCGGSHFLYRPVEPGTIMRPTVGRPSKAAAQNPTST